MKTQSLLTSVFLVIMPSIASAAWQVASPQAAAPREPFFQANAHTALPAFTPAPSSSKRIQTRYTAIGPTALYAVSVSGSLKENIERIMGRYHWRVIWKAPYDFNFDGRITGTSLNNVVEKLLKPFPLQAVMYMSNRTLTVSSKAKT